MKYTFVGDWYNVPDLAPSFAVVAEGDNYEQAKRNAEELVLEQFPDRASGGDGESPRALWGEENGAYVVGVFAGDLSGQAVESPTFELIA